MENISILEDFKNDDVYKLFLTDDFDVKTVTSSAVQLVAVTEHLAKLSSGIALLDKELHHQVANHYEDLLSQATEIETLEGVLQMVHGRIQTLLSSADRLRRNVVDPYEAVSSQTVMLVRLQMTCDLLRRIIRVMQLCRRLEVQLQGNVGEVIKAAQSINELDYLMEGVDLSGLHIIENHLQLIKTARDQVHNQANALLLKGIESQERLDVATALQVFHNLQILKPTVHQILEQTKNKICQNVQDALDVQRLSCQSQDAAQKIHGPGRAAIPLAGNTAAFRASLWTNMENLMSSTLNAFYRIQHLQNVLMKKRDPVSHSRFLDELEMDGTFNIAQSLWEVITTTLTDEFSRAADESTYIKQAFEVEFPKLLCMFNEFSKSLHDHGCQFLIKKQEITSEDAVMKSSVNEKLGSGINNYVEDPLRKALAPFETAYLSRCLSRLTDSVNVVYAGEGQTAPTTEDIEGIMKAISSELSAASIDPLLLKSVAKNVAQTVNFFVEKCQYLVSVDSDSVQVIDQPNPNQLLNARVVNLLHLLQKQLIDVLEQGNFTEEAIAVIKNSLQSAESLISIAVEPLFHSILSAVEAIIMTMHKEDFSSQTVDDSSMKTPEAPCSLYMKELQKFIIRSQTDYLSLYPECDGVTKGVLGLASHSIEMFVRHASLVRPLGDGGKMRLAADCAQMEMAVTTWCQKVGDLGRAYRLLRSFRPLLFQTSNHIAQSPAICDIVPYSIALQFLFSRAPPELKSPHEVAGWSLEEYSRWLDDHTSEKERLILIKGALEKYVAWVKQRQDKEFCSVYPVVVDILQRGLQANT